MEYSGVVGRVNSKPWNNKTFWSFALRGQDGWYNTGMKKPPTEGTSISFVAVQNTKGYQEVDYNSIKTLEDGPAARSTGVAAVSRSAGNGIGKDDYWNRKEERDVKNDGQREVGASRNTAISIIDLMLKHEVVKLPAQAKREGFIWELLDTYTNKLMGKDSEPETAVKEEEVATEGQDDWK